MEWYDDRAIREDSKTTTAAATTTAGVLTATSGNAQFFSSNTKNAEEQESGPSESGPSWPTSRRYPIPGATLRSNDRRTLARQNLNLQILKKRLRLAQAYLQHPKFLEFKRRARKDVDKGTGEVIWDDETETAFHNAIINIPAMGKSKKSQLGKICGRNELISEWIKQETGKKRVRKQVSSHIQTLDNLFKAKPEENFAGIPEWRKMTKRPSRSTSEYEGPDFYDNSVADMVRQWKVFIRDSSHQSNREEVELGPPHFDQSESSPADDDDDLHRLIKLEFDMWVSLPGKMNEALHRYTCIRCSENWMIPEPLSQLPNWRMRWPDLGPLIDKSWASEIPEIILLDASFELMADFPPPRSKLGISLELSFGPSRPHGLPMNHDVTWNCVTHVYRQGRREAQLEHRGCHTPRRGSVKPPFESKWWAEQFTRLTEERRHAVDSGDDTAVAVADEATRAYLQSVTIMQQIFVDSRHPYRFDYGGEDHSSSEKRLVVLLWTFAQAPAGTAASTAWRRLMPPFINDPPGHDPLVLPKDECLPALAANTSIEETYNDSIHTVDPAATRHQEGLIPNLYAPEHDGISHTGLDMPAEDGFATTAISCDNFIVCRPLHPNTHDHAAIHLDSADHLEGHHAQYDNLYAEVLHSNHVVQHVYHTQGDESRAHAQPLDRVHVAYGPSADLPPRNEPRSLHMFDRNTHRMLQARLHQPYRLDHPLFQHHVNSAPSHQPAAAAAANIGIQSPHVTTDYDEELLRRALMADAAGQARADTMTKRSADQMQGLHRYTSHQGPAVPVLTPSEIRAPFHYHHDFPGVLGSNVGDVSEELSRPAFPLLTDYGLDYVDRPVGPAHRPTISPPPQGFILDLDLDQPPRTKRRKLRAERAGELESEATRNEISESQTLANEKIHGSNSQGGEKEEEESVTLVKLEEGGEDRK